MFRKFDLTLPDECADRVSAAYKSSELIIEYGAGGSTFIAAQSGATILTVESSSTWLAQLMGAIQEANLPGRVIPLWANIGKTAKWGFPADKERAEHWHEYALLPWRYCSEHALAPDTVLIDGRFRTACFVAAAVSTVKPVTIMVDDYRDREWYRWVEDIIKPTEMVDRLAVFEVKPGMVDVGVLLEHIDAFVDPR